MRRVGVALVVSAAAVLSGMPDAHADRVRVRPVLWAGGGYESNPLVLSTAHAPSRVANAGAWLNVDLAFGPFTRVYTQAGALVTSLPDLDLSTGTGFAEVRFLRRIGALDIEARGGGFGSDVSHLGAPADAPAPAGSTDLGTLASTGDSWTATSSLSVTSRPATVRVGAAAVGAWTTFPGRYVPGTTDPERIQQVGGMAFMEVRYGRIAANAAIRGVAQDSVVPAQRGTGGEAHGGVWIDLHREVSVRVRAEGRRFVFPEDGDRVDENAAGQAGMTLGHPGRMFRLDVAATAATFRSTRGDWQADRTSVLVTLQVAPRGIRW